MSLLEGKKKVFIALTFVSIVTFTSSTYPQEAASIPVQSSPLEAPAPYFLNANPPKSDGSLGEFYPHENTILDNDYPFWNGKPVLVERDAVTNEIIGGIFNFSRVLVPAGVTVKFKGYKYVVINSIGNIEIAGVVDANGQDGIMGFNGQSGPPGFRGGDGGAGGAGGGTGSMMGNGGAGGQGGGSAIAGGQGADGMPGAGPTSSRRPSASCTINCTQSGACGGAGGGYGTAGANGAGPGGPLGVQPFGDVSVGLNPEPAVGGGQSSGGCGFRCNGVVTFCGGGGGGGSGGAGGTIIMQSMEDITVVGKVMANGGDGGNGGNGGLAGCRLLPPFPIFVGCNGGGGGGGGAGGSILLTSAGQIFVANAIAQGGLGGTHGSGGPALPGRDGYDGGAGGGGRIAAYAAGGVDGITASNGSPAAGRDTVGQPTQFAMYVTQDRDLWYLCGQPAVPGYNTQATLTAQGATTGTFTWQVVQGGDKVVLGTQTANTISVTSTAASSAPKDVAISLTYNGIFAGNYKLTVYKPFTFTQQATRPDLNAGVDCNDIGPGRTQGFASIQFYNVTDIDNRAMPNFPVNEVKNPNFSNCQGNNWGLISPNIGGYTDGIGRASDTMCVTNATVFGWNPAPQVPQTPLRSEQKMKVIFLTTYAGSTTAGQGCPMFSTEQTWFIDHAKHCNNSAPPNPNPAVNCLGQLNCPGNP